MTVDIDVGAVPAGGPCSAYVAETAGPGCRGLTSKAIAEEPVRAPVTVARHVVNIFTEPDVSSWVLAAVCAADQRDVPGAAP